MDRSSCSPRESSRGACLGGSTAWSWWLASCPAPYAARWSCCCCRWCCCHGGPGDEGGGSPAAAWAASCCTENWCPPPALLWRPPGGACGVGASFAPRLRSAATELLDSGLVLVPCDWDCDGGRRERGSLMPSNHGARSASRAGKRFRGSICSTALSSCICGCFILCTYRFSSVSGRLTSGYWMPRNRGFLRNISMCSRESCPSTFWITKS
mmetsp:Transcript_48351/g.125412  ORF Transcript_48351/g.125412 Transcript_48351/m.125412 type:complete len:211 (+) Transcript_48351:453-1085(+)